ncbi:MAG: ribosome biogenesis GTP-binding protein YihA/YsxC, partial [Thermodesulfobacteriota bacterium]|nr:ribosome biogenesis GTP-binding protein YihA/YsxC [Thermodesulfobacteriota bacterium]
MAVKTVPKIKYPIRQADFIISAVQPEQFPAADRPEIAFAGRSNVGKSSLLNKLLLRRKLARTSRTPGRTQTINFFDVNGEMYFVDLPGYGYAKVPQAVQAAWGPMVEGYLDAPRDLRTVVVLVDIRRDPGGEEENLMDWLNRR